MLGAMGPRILGATLVGLPATALVLLGWLAPASSALGAAMHRLGGWICHAEPARSFVGAPVCHRCVGIYTGLALGGLLALAVPRVPHERLGWWAIALGPLALQVALGVALPVLDRWFLRVGSGLLSGALVALAVAHAIAALTRAREHPP